MLSFSWKGLRLSLSLSLSAPLTKCDPKHAYPSRSAEPNHQADSIECLSLQFLNTIKTP